MQPPSERLGAEEGSLWGALSKKRELNKYLTQHIDACVHNTYMLAQALARAIEKTHPPSLGAVLARGGLSEVGDP